jgi:hypothetical protein
MTEPRLTDIPETVWYVTYSYKETVAELIDHLHRLEAEYPGKELNISIEATEEWYRYDPQPSHSMKMSVYYLREETDEEYKKRVDNIVLARETQEAWEKKQLEVLREKYEKAKTS